MCDMPIPFGTEYNPSYGSYEADTNNPLKYELRAGRMYTNCECSRRNGLQDSCPRSTGHEQSGNMNQQYSKRILPSASYPPNFLSMNMEAANPGFVSSNNAYEQQFEQPSSAYSFAPSGYQQNGYQNEMMSQMTPGFEMSNPGASYMMPPGASTWDGSYSKNNSSCYM